MFSFRCRVPKFLALASVLFAFGCSSQEVVVEETPKESWVGKKVVVKYCKTKRYLFTPKGEIRPAGDFAGYTGVVKAESKKEDGDYALVRTGREDFWVKSDDVVPFDQAEAYFDKQLEESPRSYEPRVLRAAMQMDSGRPDKALEDLAEANRQKPNVHYPLTVRAKAYEMLGENKKALEDYETVLKFDPNNLMVFLGRARVLHALGRTDLALVDLDRAIKFDRSCVQAYLQRARLWEFKKEDAAALVDYERAGQIDPNDPGIPTARAEYWLRKKDFVKANDDFDHALKIEPEHFPALTGKAIVLSRSNSSSLRDPKRAVDLAQKACDLSGWKDFESIEVLGVAHAAAGNFQEAAKYVRQALDDPLFNKAHGEKARKHLVLFQNNLPLSFE
ncbi:MAG: hypothetical protein U0798_06675 [Gemmataceae bacterium]